MEEENEIVVSAFDYQQILPFHSILIVENNPLRAAALINRVLRTISHFEEGKIFTLSSNVRFRYPKRVERFEKKQFPKEMEDVYYRQAFHYSFESNPEQPETFPLHFLPKQVLNLHPLLQNLSEKQYLELNKLMKIPRSFLVFHHCFSTFPRNDFLSKILYNHTSHNRLLLIVSCSLEEKISKELSSQFDWILFFPSENQPIENELDKYKRWFKSSFEMYFHSYRLFLLFLSNLRKTQGMALQNPFQYNEITNQKEDLRISLLSNLENLDEQTPLQNSCIKIIKRLVVKNS